MNECITCQSHADDYINKEIGNDDKKLFLQHLAMCEECRKYLTMCVKLRSIIKSLQQETPHNLNAAVLRQIKTEDIFSTENIVKETIKSPLSMVYNLIAHILEPANLAVRQSLVLIEANL